MDAHLASAGGFELNYAARTGNRNRCNEFYKSRLALSLAVAPVGSHQEPFQFSGVEVQLLRRPIHALPTSNVDSHRPQLFRDRCLP
jgi:hypothetical protein